MKHKNQGFSMTEIIIVVGVLAILVTALTPTLIKYIGKAQKAVDISNAQELGKLCERIMIDDDDAYYSFYSHSTGPFQVTDTTDPNNPQTYQFSVVLYYKNQHTRWVAANPRPGGATYINQELFLDRFVEELYGDSNNFKAKTSTKIRRDVSGYKNLGKPDHFVIGYRRKTNSTDTYVGDGSEAVEVWAAASGADSKPIYKLYPTVCSEYAEYGE